MARKGMEEVPKVAAHELSKDIKEVIGGITAVSQTLVSTCS
jgi:hypothetical protein